MFLVWIPLPMMNIPSDCVHLIQAVPTERVSNLSPSCVIHFTERQIKAIPLYETKLVQAISKDQMQFINKNHVPFLLNSQIPWIPVQLIPVLKKHQLSHICAEQIPFLTETQRQMIPIDRFIK